jgi:hypothetical protein
MAVDRSDDFTTVSPPVPYHLYRLGKWSRAASSSAAKCTRGQPTKQKPQLASVWPLAFREKQVIQRMLGSGQPDRMGRPNEGV